MRPVIAGHGRRVFFPAPIVDREIVGLWPRTTCRSREGRRLLPFLTCASFLPRLGPPGPTAHVELEFAGGVRDYDWGALGRPIHRHRRIVLSHRAACSFTCSSREMPTPSPPPPPPVEAHIKDGPAQSRLQKVA